MFFQIFKQIKWPIKKFWQVYIFTSIYGDIKTLHTKPIFVIFVKHKYIL